MSIVANIDLVERSVGRWQPSDIAFIRRFEFENRDGFSFDLILQTLLQPRPSLSSGWPNPAGSFWDVVIAFERVREFSFNITGPWDHQTEGFVIEDISTSQWEGVRLRVYDYEGGPLQFNAWSANIRSCTSASLGPTCPSISRVYPGTFPDTRSAT